MSSGLISPPRTGYIQLVLRPVLAREGRIRGTSSRTVTIPFAAAPHEIRGPTSRAESGPVSVLSKRPLSSHAIGGGQSSRIPGSWDCNSFLTSLPFPICRLHSLAGPLFSCCFLPGTLLLAPARTFRSNLVLGLSYSSLRGTHISPPPKSEVMFRDYSLQSASRQGQSSYTHSGVPTSIYSYSTNPQPVSQSDLAVLAHQFGQQSLRYDPRTANTTYSSSTTQHQSSAPSAHYSVQPPQSAYECPHTYATVRSQRQANTRLQCQPSHAHEISTLVERMIASGEQCLICSPVPQQAPPAQDEDEGIYMGDSEYLQSSDSQTLSYRRSSDFGATQSYVPKSIRVRKARRQKGDSSRLK
jgi:hypothetical protein